MARYRRFREQILVFRKVFIGPPVFKTKLDNDSDIDQSGCTALPTCRRHVVNGTHCVGVSVLTNRLREMHARGGHCCSMQNNTQNMHFFGEICPFGWRE